ncbi:MAG: hypothetical protein LIR35_04460 [Bacteroidota bacterium]|nr:hypothetical protein [Bacteroidota bacterium]
MKKMNLINSEEAKMVKGGEVKCTLDYMAPICLSRDLIICKSRDLICGTRDIIPPICKNWDVIPPICKSRDFLPPICKSRDLVIM